MKSNFAVTCNLLSQYIKDRGAIADLGSLAIAAAAAPPAARPATMSYLPVAGGEKKDYTSIDLFPQRAGFGPAENFSAAPPPPPEKAQLTIFYGGKVLVFDNFPADKAKDLMNMANKGCATPQNVGFTPPYAAANRPNVPSTMATVPANLPAPVQKPPQPNVSSLPLARSKSLHRFLEKRKDRIQAKAPYQASDLKAPAVKKEHSESPSWLGLGPQMSKPGLNSECTR